MDAPAPKGSHSTPLRRGRPGRLAAGDLSSSSGRSSGRRVDLDLAPPLLNVHDLVPLAHGRDDLGPGPAELEGSALADRDLDRVLGQAAAALAPGR